MGLLNVIRRMALREKLPIREIARRTGLARNTIRYQHSIVSYRHARTDAFGLWDGYVAEMNV